MPGFTSSTIDRYSGRWLIVSGGFELVLAAIFLFFGLTDEAVAFGFVLTAAILGVTGLVLVGFGLRARGQAIEADRIATTGLAGTAIVTGLTQTGMQLNEQPQVKIDLLVTIPGRAPYAASRKEFVPLILLSRLSSGAPLPIKVDPSDPQDVIIDWESGALPGVVASSAAATGETETLAQVQAALAASGLPAAATFATPEQGGYSVDQLRAVVRATGIDGTATIDKLADTGETVGDERLFTMEVTLHVPGQPDRALPASAATVPLTAADKVAVGRTVPVKVAPDNPNLIVFEWDQIHTDGPTTLI